MREVTPQDMAGIMIARYSVPLETVAGFIKWFVKNADTWRQFEATALEQAQAGRKDWGAKACAEFIRYNTAGGKVEGDFKVPNEWVAYLGRAFAIKWPEYSDLFKFKEIKGVRVREAA